MNDVLHRAAKVVAGVVAEENVKPVMEELTHIRERIRYGRVMNNRRLHSIPFRRIQFYISYKSMGRGFKPETVKAENTSRTSMCGEISKPNGHFKCRRCGFQADRHLVAAWNIAMKRSMWGALPLPPKALYEPQIIEVRGRIKIYEFHNGVFGC
ncbi:MAG: zinc ribbon domain-containing protein [Candidatus Jordarchaeales archaeon]